MTTRLTCAVGNYITLSVPIGIGSGVYAVVNTKNLENDSPFCEFVSHGTAFVIGGGIGAATWIWAPIVVPLIGIHRLSKTSFFSND